MKILITSGGTSERIDNVRKITNRSSGELGSRIAQEFVSLHNVEKVYYVSEKSAKKPVDNKIQWVYTEGVEDMEKKVKYILETEKIDVLIHSMAVSDYKTKRVTSLTNMRDSIVNLMDEYGEKIAVLDEKELNDLVYKALVNASSFDSKSKVGSSHDDLIIELEKTPKVIKMIKDISPDTFLVGFKLLVDISEEHLIKVASDLLRDNKCDMVVANDLRSILNGGHTAHFVHPDGTYTTHFKKHNIAYDLVMDVLGELLEKI